MSSETVSPTRTGGVAAPRPAAPIVHNRLSAARAWIHHGSDPLVPIPGALTHDGGAAPEPTASIVAAPLVVNLRSVVVAGVSMSLAKQTLNVGPNTVQAGSDAVPPLPPTPVAPLPPVPPPPVVPASPVVPPSPVVPAPPPVPPRAQLPAPLKAPHSPRKPPVAPPAPALPGSFEVFRLAEHAASNAM